MISIKQARTIEEVEHIRSLFREYASVKDYEICFQSFEKELAELPGKYAPPTGGLFLASYENEIAGCIALKQIDVGIGEIKRLYVRPKFRGQGIGRALVSAIIDEAGKVGMECLKLETLPVMQSAVSLYKSFGFVTKDEFSCCAQDEIISMVLSLKQNE